MAVETIRHVQNDLLPKWKLTLRDENDVALDLVDLSPAEIRMHIREVGAVDVKTTVPCTMLTGLLQDDGTVSVVAPYNVAGKGGRVQVELTALAVDTAGSFEGEVELVFAGGETQTTYETVPILIRGQFA